MIEIIEMDPSEIGRIADIDRSERIDGVYVYQRGALHLQETRIDAPPWYTDGRPDHSIEANIRAWKPLLDQNGTLLGVFEEDRLIGVAIYRPRLSPDTGQLAVLHVDRGHRGQGIGAALTERVIELAKADRARWLYVSATPTKATVEFYQGQGFRLAPRVNPELYALEPEDIHMIREL